MKSPKNIIRDMISDDRAIGCSICGVVLPEKLMKRHIIKNHPRINPIFMNDIIYEVGKRSQDMGG